MKTKQFIYRILLIASLLAGSANVFAQGIYSRNAAASEENTEDENSTLKRSGTFRASSTENSTDRGNQNKISPLGDGWEVILITGIGYACFITRRKAKE
jgi:hypothetical protein